MDRLISSLGGVDHITDDWVRIGQAKADLSVAGIVYLDDRMYLCAAYPSMPVNPRAQSRYVLIIELSVPEIRELLMSFNMYPQGGSLLASVSYEYQIIAGDDIGLSGSRELLRGNDPMVKAAAHKNNGSRYMVVGSSSEYLNMNLYTYVSEQLIYGPLARYNVLFLLFSAVAIIAVILFLFSAHILVNKPLKLLVHSLKKMEEGDFKIRIKSHANDEFDYLYRAFNNMASSLENLIELNYRSRMLTQKAELKQLQAQINPHFLYNSFFILYCMAKDRDYENITLFLTYLSDYYRYITRNILDDVMLKDEVEHARRYAQIQLVRFKRRIQIDFAELNESYDSIRVPHLILQPLLENAFNHGLKDVPSGGLLRVCFVPEQETLVIVVADNGKGISHDERERLLKAMDSADDTAEVSGLINIHRRLRLKFGPAYGLSIGDTALGGAVLELRIPLREPESTERTVQMTGEGNVPAFGDR
jgi:two-component system sensor histidine kinase YesM